MATDLVSRCDNNYWASMARLAEAVSGEPAVQEDGLLLASCRSPIGYFNSAFLTPSDRRSTLDRLARAVDFYSQQGVPFVVRTRREITPDVAGAARQVGLEETTNMPIMALLDIDAIPAPPAGLVIEAVTDADGLAAHTEVVTSAFGVPLELAQRLFGPAVIDMPGSQMFVGRIDGEPVATSLVSVTDDMAGIYNVATLEHLRRRGLGEALTWWAVAAGVRAGASSASLQASAMGRPVYERMGFHVVDDYLQYQGG